MVYGADAVLPAEVRHNAPRIAAYNEEDSIKAMKMQSIYYTKLETQLLQERLYTNKDCVTTMPVESAAERST